MSRISIIILSSLGLMIIGVIFLFINAGKKSTAETEVEVMTKDPDKYTYQQLMATVGEHGLSLDDGEQVPAASSQPAINRELLADDSVPVEEEAKEAGSADIPAQEVATALQQIRQARLQFSGDSTPVQTRQKPDTRRKNREEDETIRNIVAQHALATEQAQRSEQPEQHAIVPAGFNSMQFGQRQASPAAGSTDNSIPGVILNEAEVISGAVVRIMLQDGHKIVSGTVNVGSERVQIRVPGAVVAARFSETFFSVYGQDGTEGLRIEGGPDPARQATKDEVESNISQVAGSGILGGVVSIAKTLGTANKGKQQVKIPSGLKITLKTISH